eukprot:superscaffoldBa00000817_g7405
MASGGEGPSSSPHRHTNRLAKERSPYLLQHAHNPVDWESFEDEEIGKILSDNFVCIKVDREERPDVDKVYMTFVQATSGGGGWPMSVWLTPDLRPFIGGTYFPPRDHARRPGLITVLTRIMDQWQNNRSNLESSGDRILEALKKGTAVAANPGQSPPLAPDVANRCFQQLAHSYEEEYGGFRDAPKFPTPVNLMFLMSYWSVNRSTSEGVEALQMALHTLRMMALGGIHDHVAQVHTCRHAHSSTGFHRYSTDSSWHVPHFEKMLYDQAQLAVAYITASQSGGFYSAEDADSVPASGGPEKREGAFCVWTASEVRELLPDVVEGATGSATQADIFMHHYGVKEQGNVDLEQDPHGELQGQNVLIVRYSVELTAARFGISVGKVNELLASARGKMAEVRKSRPRPHLDTKMLASWNGLMLSAYARVGAVLGDKALLERAEQAGNFLKQHLWDAERQTILRSCYRGDKMEVEQIQGVIVGIGGRMRCGSSEGAPCWGVAAVFGSVVGNRGADGGRVVDFWLEVRIESPPISGFLDDYSFIICGLLDLYEATLQTDWLKWAEELQVRQDELFWDEQGGGYFCSDPSDSTVLLQLKEDQDGAEPSANSVSASNLLRLSHYTGRQEWLQRSQQLLAAFSDRLTRVPIALPEMVRALMAQHYTLKQIVISGQRDAPDTTSLLAVVNSLFLPHKVLMLLEGDAESFLCQRLPALSSMSQQGGAATAYVCQDFTCSLPVNDPQELRRQLLDGHTQTQTE